MQNATRFLAAVLMLLFIGTAHAQETLDEPVWEITPADVDWLSATSTVRGGAINPVTGHLLIPSREEPLSVQVLNPVDGSSVGTLDVTDVAGGVFVLNKIAVTSDGQIFATNLQTATAASDPIKIYYWADENAAPVVAYEGAPASGRFGDSFSVSGSGGDVAAYLSGGGSQTNIAIFEWDDDSFGEPRLISITANAAQTGLLKVAGEDSLWINNPVGGTLRKISLADGTVGTTVGGDVVHTYLGELAEFHIGGRTYLAVGPGRHDEDNFLESRVVILDVTDVDNIEVVAETTRWGTTDNRFAPGGFVTFDEANTLLIAGVTQNPIRAFSLEFLLPEEPITLAEVRGLPLGSEVYFEAVVNRARGAFTSVQDETAGFTLRQTSGAFRDSVDAGAVREGTRIRVRGTTSEFRQMIQINQGDIIDWEIIDQNNPVEPVTVTLQQIADNGEDYKGQLVRVEGLTVDTDATEFAAATSYDVSDATLEAGTIELRVPNASDTDVVGMAIPTRTFTFTGRLGQFHTTDPDAGYQLMLVEQYDIQEDAVVWDDPVWAVRPGDEPWLVGTGNTMRGGAYNPVTDHVLVASRAPTLGVHILHPANGQTIGQLDVTGISGGTFALSEIAVTEDGQIFGANLHVDGDGIKVYRWENEDATPELLWEGNLPARAGDSFFAAGSGDDVRIYISGTFNDTITIFHYDGETTTIARTITPEATVDRARMGIAEGATHETLWINGPGTALAEVDAEDGEILREVSLDVLGTSFGDIAYFELEGRSYILAGSTEGNTTDGYTNKFVVVDVTEEGGEFRAYETPFLGIHENAFFIGWAAFDTKRNNALIGGTNVIVAAFSMAEHDNQAPLASDILTPADGAEITIEGDGETEFTATWSEATDPDDDTVLYFWQLSASPNFDELIVDANVGTETSFTTDFETIAGIMDAAGVAVEGNITLYHRVITSDGELTTTGSTSTVVLTRGTLTNVEPGIGLPTEFALHGNYPNPFNPTTNIRFDLPQSADVRVEMYDILGRQVMTMQHSMQAGANQTISVDAAHLASGTYLYRVVAEMQGATRVETGKMLLVK
jgi:hypothetical protein